MKRKLNFTGPMTFFWEQRNTCFLAPIVFKFCYFNFKLLLTSSWLSEKIANSVISQSVFKWISQNFKLSHFKFNRPSSSSWMSQKFSTGPCFLSHGLKSFCKEFNVEIFYCTKGDHRANGLVETIV